MSALFANTAHGATADGATAAAKTAMLQFGTGILIATQRNGRRLVVVQMYGTSDLYGRAIGLFDCGFS